MLFTIASQDMERHLRFEPGRGLRTTAWKRLSTQTDYLAGPAFEDSLHYEFAFRLNHAHKITSLEADWELGAVESQPHHLSIQLLRDELEVNILYQGFAQHPAIRKQVSITNHAGHPITLSQWVGEALELRAGDPESQVVYGVYGQAPRELFYTGRAEDCALYQKNALTGEGFLILNEAPGILKRTDTAWTWQGGVAAGYDTDIFPFERSLAPGETFRPAAVNIAFVQDGTASAPQWVIPRYSAEVLQKKTPAHAPKWHYNTWETFFKNIDATLISQLIPPAAQMGLDIFTIDDGWALALGSNDVDLSRFPDGLDPLLEQVETAGMRLGLWFPLAVVGNQTRIYQEHPEWACIDGLGKPRQTFTMSGWQQVMCLATPYRDWVADHISEAVARYRLAYIKLDLTTVFNTYGEGPGCYAEGHEHRTWADSLGRIYEGIAAITQTLYERFPNLLIDLTFELWGQKHLIDYGLLRMGDLDWLSNVHDLGPGGPRQARTLLYQRALAIPAEAMLIGNLQAHVEPIAERFGTAIGSAPLLLGDLRQLSSEQIRWYRQHIDWYKELRQRLPLYQSFFPLGAWQQPNAAEWDGFARLSEQGEGILVVFRNQSSESSARVKWPIFGQGRYQLRAFPSGQVLPPFGAEELREGITIPLDAAVSLWEVRAI